MREFQVRVYVARAFCIFKHVLSSAHGRPRRIPRALALLHRVKHRRFTVAVLFAREEEVIATDTRNTISGLGP